MRAPSIFLLGSAQGLSSTGSTRWDHEAAGVSDTAERLDNFASALGALHPALVAPAALAPADGARTDSQPSLQWTPAVLATRYQLQVAAGQAWDAAVVDVWLTGTGCEPSVPLPDGGFRWRVRLRDSVGRQSAWSEPRQFRVGSLNYLPLLKGR